MKSSAKFSADRKHRFLLERIWDASLPPFLVIGLNPSTADENVDDPTIRRCIAFAKREKCGSLVMLNLFSYRSTDPSVLKTFDGLYLTCESENQRWVKRACQDALSKGGRIVCAWGAHGSLHDYGAFMRVVLGEYPLKCFGHTKSGEPKHPLYLKMDTPLIDWRPSSVRRQDK